MFLLGLFGVVLFFVGCFVSCSLIFFCTLIDSHSSSLCYYLLVGKML